VERVEGWRSRGMCRERGIERRVLGREGSKESHNTIIFIPTITLFSDKDKKTLT
jgi:hypothetical protein